MTLTPGTVLVLDGAGITIEGPLEVRNIDRIWGYNDSFLLELGIQEIYSLTVWRRGRIGLVIGICISCIAFEVAVLRTLLAARAW